MSLLLDGVTTDGLAPVHVEVPAGEARRLAVADADLLLRALAGTVRGAGRVLLGRRDLGRLPADERSRRGLATVDGRLPDLPGLRVSDVVLLGRPVRHARWWQIAAGTGTARDALAEAEAAVRNLSGRMGLARWLDRDAVGLPPAVQALTDALRALASSPRAVVWRIPEWLPAEDVGAVAEVLDEERARLGFPVLEVSAAGGGANGERRP